MFESMYESMHFIQPEASIHQDSSYKDDTFSEGLYMASYSTATLPCKVLIIEMLSHVHLV